MCHALGIAMLGYNSAEGVGAQRLPLAGEPEEVGADVGALHAVVEGEALQGERNGVVCPPRLRIKNANLAEGGGHAGAVVELPQDLKRRRYQSSATS